MLEHGNNAASYYHNQTLEAWKVAQDILGSTVDDRPITLVNDKTPVWVFLDGQEDGDPSRLPSVALRLMQVNEVDRSFTQAKNNAALIEQLRGEGARVLEVLEEPTVHRERYVAMLSRYICAAEVTAPEHGKSVATLHNAGKKLGGTPPTTHFFNPLHSLGNTIAFLHAEQEERRGYRIGSTVFSPELLESLDQYYSEALVMLLAIDAYAKQRQVTYVPLQEDVQADNVRGKEATLIDLDSLQIGPREYDLGRPRTQWARQRQDGNLAAIGFMAGYELNTQTPLDMKMLRMTGKISLIKYCTAHITLSVTQLLEGRRPSEWLLREGIQRLSQIANPRHPWQKLDLAQKTSLAAAEQKLA